MNDILHRHFSSKQDRVAIGVTGALLINLVMGLAQLAIGIYSSSGWLTVNATYLLLLCVARGYIVWRYTHSRLGNNLSSELHIYKQGGIFMCLLGATYFIICLWMLLGNEAVRYPGTGMILYVAVALAFAKVGFSIHGFIVARRLKTPVISVMKTLNIADTMVAIVITQCSLLLDQRSASAITSSAWLGLGFSLIIVIIGIVMLSAEIKRPA